MVSVQDIRVNAQNPAFPLIPIQAFKGSSATLKLLGVPKNINDLFVVNSVYITVTKPNNQVESISCERKGSLWIGTMTQCDVVGKISNGYTITAYGLDEHGESSSWVLGAGDVSIMNNDGLIPEGVVTYNVHLYTTEPLSPNKGDMVATTGVFKVYNGTAWIEAGDATKLFNDDKTQYISGDKKIYNSSGVQTGTLAETSELPTKTSDLTNDSGFITSASVPTKTSDLTNDSGFITSSSLPTKVSDLTNDSRFIGTTQSEGVDNGLTRTVKTSWLNNDADFADKTFVNSSIATNTATFRGTYNSVAELPTTGITNNDYAFVVSTDAHGNTIYNRYKYSSTTSTWAFEYALNNSSFTAAQWATINSGLTSTSLNPYAKTADIDVTRVYSSDRKLVNPQVGDKYLNGSGERYEFKTVVDYTTWNYNSSPDLPEGSVVNLVEYDSGEFIQFRWNYELYIDGEMKATDGFETRQTSISLWATIGEEQYYITSTRPSSNQWVKDTSYIPTKTSDLTNDSNFLTSSDIQPSPITSGWANCSEWASMATSANNASNVPWSGITSKPSTILITGTNADSTTFSYTVQLGA